MILCARAFLIWLLVLVHFIPQASAQALRGDPPAITVTVESGAALPYSVGLNVWNGAVFDRMDTFGIYYGEHRDENIPSVPLGDTIRITFDGDPPDGWTLYDFANGARNEKRILPLDWDGSTAAFTLTAFPEELLDTLSVEYGLLPDPRGFLLVCGWGDNVCEYVFLLTTDTSLPTF